MQQFEDGQQITYTNNGNTYSGKIQDIGDSMLGVIRDGDGTYDAILKRNVIVETPHPREFKVGDRVRMTAGYEPKYVRGSVPEEEIGVIDSVDRDGDYEVNFPSEPHMSWTVHPDDIEHADLIVLNIQHLPEISLDEAVANWQNVAQQIKELQASLAGLERVMRKHGVKPL